MNPGSFRPDELVGSDKELSDPERAQALAAARELEQALSTHGVHPPAGFTDRVMAAVAREPLPRPTGFLAPLRARHSLAGVVASVRVAWSVAAGSGRPASARGVAMAYVLAVLIIGASLTGVAAIGTAGAIGILSPDSPRPSIVINGPTTSPEPSSDTSEPSESIEPSGSLEPSESPDAPESGEPSDSAHPEDTNHPDATATPRSSDDHGDGGSQSPAASDDHADASASPRSSEDPGGSGSSQSPKPSETPRPSD